MTLLSKRGGFPVSPWEELSAAFDRAHHQCRSKQDTPTDTCIAVIFNSILERRRCFANVMDVSLRLDPSALDPRKARWI